MMPFLKTPAAADLLGVGYWRLIGLLRSKRLAPPHKDSSGDYVWTPEDLERARMALGTRPSPIASHTGGAANSAAAQPERGAEE